MDLMRAPSAVILVIGHIAKEMTRMNLKKTLAFAVGILLAATCLAQFGARGKAELKAGSGSITIDYGQPSLKGRDMLSQLKEGSFWRMGNNMATVLKTPVDLAFGSTKVPKGDYSLWLKRASADQFELVFNSQTGQWGMQHDESKDVYKVPMKKDAVKDPVEVFNIRLDSAPKGGLFVLTWGATLLKADFEFAK
jgi:hypothetical protein